MNKFDYTITIQWSDEDNCFVVFSLNLVRMLCNLLLTVKPMKKP